jgi:uncharacterized protein YkwD
MRIFKFTSIVWVFIMVPLLGCAPANDGSGDGDTAGDTTDGSASSGGDAGDGTSGVDDGGSDTGSSLDFDAQGHQITLSWAGDEAPFQRVVLTQGQAEHVFGGSAATVATVEPGAWGDPTFNDLSAGSADYRIESAGDAAFSNATVLEQGSIQVAEHFTHAFDNLILGGVDISGFANRAAVGETVTFQGTVADLAIKSDIYLATPEVHVKLVSMSADSTLTSGESFSFSYTFETAGMYVFELSATNGIPQGTWPVYVGTGLPLAVQELDQDYPDPLSEPLPMADMRAETLQLVNEMRKGAGVGELVSHPLLDLSAELKCAHMNEHEYFGHSFGGKKRADFAEEAGLSGGQLNEQLVVENNARRAFWFLYWSPLHRIGLLKSDKVSLGSAAAVAAFDSYGRLVFTYHLSTEMP